MKSKNVLLFSFLLLFYTGCTNKNIEKCDSKIITNKIIEDNSNGIKKTPAFNFLKENIEVNFHLENIKNTGNSKNIYECSADLILEYSYLKESENEEKSKLLNSIGLNKVGQNLKEKHNIKYMISSDKEGNPMIK
jgi:hypothetical protein